MNPKLKAIYDQVPGVNCKGLCHGACGPVPATALEREEIRKLTGRRVKTEVDFFADKNAGDLKILKTDEDNLCLYLKKERCSVYEARPLICRVYGVADGLRCGHGCWPERLLSREEAMILSAAIREVK
jgi:Fe-S-cluster containining protein